MKELQIVVRIDETTNQMAHAIKHKGFGTDDLTCILTTIGILDNLKQQFIDKLTNKSKVIK